MPVYCHLLAWKAVFLFSLRCLDSQFRCITMVTQSSSKLKTVQPVNDYPLREPMKTSFASKCTIRPIFKPFF